MGKQATTPAADHGASGAGKAPSKLSGKLKIAGIILAVVIVEWLLASFYMPGSASTTPAAGAEAAASEAEHAAEPAAAAHEEHGGHGKAAAKEAVVHHGDQQEVDLGEFTVTAYQPVSNSTLFFSFHLYGTILHKHADEFTHRLNDSKIRIRDNVIVIIRSAEIADLTDAGLGLIKRRILETTNKTLGKPLLQGVMFSDFSFVEQ